MKSLDFCRHALGIGTAAAILAACGGSQSAATQLPVTQDQSQSQSARSSQMPTQNAGSVHYRLIDMGTFGGPSSQGTNINLSGETTVIGWSATTFRQRPHAHPLICGGSDNIIKFVTHAFQWREGRVADLGSLGGPRYCSIPAQNPPNARGDIAGSSENGAYDPQTGVNQSRAVLWRNERIHDLGSFGGNQNQALAINDNGEVVGLSLNTTPDQYSLFDIFFFGSSSGTQTRAFLWKNGRMRDLGTLGTGNDATANFINRRGQIAGNSYTNATPNGTTGVPTVDPFLWDRGRMIDLGTLGGTFSLVSAMNDRGQVVGQSNLAGDAVFHPFYWNGSKIIDIGTAGGSVGAAWGISDRDEVIGVTNMPGDKYEVGFVWKNGVRTDLPPLTGDCGSAAWAIDSRGRVFGDSYGCGAILPSLAARHVVIWDHGTITNLGNLVDKRASLEITNVGGLSQTGPGIVNDRGEIVGIGVPHGVARYNSYKLGRAFLLIPERR